MRNQRGQVTVEAALLWTFVVAAFVFLGFYLQRAAQGGLKANADGLGTQFSSTSSFSTFSQSKTHETATQTVQTSCNEYTQALSDPGAGAGAAIQAPDCTAEDAGAGP